MSLPRYPEYKESGVEWLGEVPGHWEVKRLKQTCHVFPSNVDKKTREDETPVNLCNYTDVYYHDTITADMEFMAASASTDQITKFTLRAGDTIITKDSETADDIAISAYVPIDLPGVICGYHLSMLRPMTDTNGAFIKRLFDSTYVKSCVAIYANGLTRVGLGQYEIDNLEIPFPPIDEQTQIADFLDRETGKIDALIAEQQRLVELLAEKRQAVISHAVTKGLNPNATMKDSGIEWLGEVPKHWVIGGLTRFIGPVVDYRGRTPTKVDEGIFLVTARNVRDGKIDYEASEEFVEPDSAASLLARGKPEIGDLLFTMEAPLGQVALIDRTDIALAQRIVKFCGTPNVMQNRFLLYWFMSTHCQARLETLATGSTALGIKASKLGMIECLVPSLDEQTEIADHIEYENAKFDTLTTEVRSAIALLQERRSTLISAAVTGKFNVTH
ncbi:MAG: restriction endonuclease subunit S [Burkholderiales bacterium]